MKSRLEMRVLRLLYSRSRRPVRKESAGASLSRATGTAPMQSACAQPDAQRPARHVNSPDSWRTTRAIRSDGSAEVEMHGAIRDDSDSEIAAPVEFGSSCT